MKGNRKKLPCTDCGATCCRYIAVEIDKPTCKRDYDQIRWYLLHENVYVFVDGEGAWYVEFGTGCSKLQKDNLCRIYEERPRICRSYGRGDAECEFLARTAPYVLRFRTSKEFETYLDKRGMDWRWKRAPKRGRSVCRNPKHQRSDSENKR